MFFVSFVGRISWSEIGEGLLCAIIQGNNGLNWPGRRYWGCPGDVETTLLKIINSILKTILCVLKYDGSMEEQNSPMDKLC